MKNFNLFFVMVMCVSLHGQDIIENPKKPLSRDSGRIIELKEVMRITDGEQQNYYFQWVSNPRIGPDGSIYIPSRDQFLHFDKGGNFVRNLLKKGQGPQEMMFMGGYSFQDDQVIVHGKLPPKIIWFQNDGEINRELYLEEKSRWLDYQFFNRDLYYFIETIPAVPDKKESTVEVEHDLISISAENQHKSKLLKVITRQHIVLGSQGSQVINPLSIVLTAVYLDRYLFISHTSEYSIKVFDTQTNNLLRTFSRDYKRVKETKEDRKSGAFVDGRNVVRPAEKYRNDLTALHSVGDRLWAVTSTRNKKKGCQVDEFDIEGRFTDMFFLKFPAGTSNDSLNSRNTVIDGEYVYTVERDEDDLITIVKYKLES